MSLLSDDDKALLVLEHLGPAALAGDTMSLYDCFQLALDVAEKAVLAKLASAELPEPAFALSWKADQGRYTVNKPNIDSQDCYTADQLRQAHAQGFAAGVASQLSAEPVFFAYQYDDGTWHDGSATEHSVGMKHLYTRREAK